MLLKSLFISAFPTFLALAAAFSGWQIAENQFVIANIFVLIAVVPFLLFLAVAFGLTNIARTSESPWYFFVSPIVGSVGAMYLLMNQQAEWLHVALSVAGLVGSFIYVYWYSVFGREQNDILEVGKTLPEFELFDENRNAVSSKEISQQPALLMFYRGNWCPLCMAQIKEVAATYKEMEKRGIKVYMISPQSHKNTAELASRFDVNFNFLVDKDNQAAERLKIKAENGLPMGLQAMGYDSDVPMPTVVMLDANGKIIFADLTDNYRVRPEPQDFLKVFDQHLATV